MRIGLPPIENQRYPLSRETVASASVQAMHQNNEVALHLEGKMARLMGGGGRGSSAETQAGQQPRGECRVEGCWSEANGEKGDVKRDGSGRER